MHHSGTIIAMKRDLVLIVHNVRSTHNVGSLLRTADGLGAKTVFLTGYSPYPMAPNDTRLPHIATKLHRQITKTALGAETSQNWQHQLDIVGLINQLKGQGYKICAIEQHPASVPLNRFKPSAKVALIVGHEVGGIESTILSIVDCILEIPMLGKKESLNVAQAAAIGLYHCRFT